MADNALWAATNQYTETALLCVTSVAFETHAKYRRWSDSPRSIRWHRWGEATAWYAHGSLTHFAQQLQSYQQHLYFLKPFSSNEYAPPNTITHTHDTCELIALLEALTAEGTYVPRTVIVDECNKPHARQSLRVLAEWCQRHDVQLRRFVTQTMVSSHEVLNQQAQPFKVFSPFWKNLFQGLNSGQYRRRTLLPIPERLPPPPCKEVLTRVQATLATQASQHNSVWQLHTEIASCALRPSFHTPQAAWDSAFTWQTGETAALHTLQHFLNQGATVYHQQRDYPSTSGTSKLSAALHFGEISPLQLWHAIETQLQCPLSETQALKNGHGMGTLLREVGWREFAYYLLYHFPDTTDAPLNPAFDTFPWEVNAEALTRWQHGQTGYPMIDAGMRELWATGWMHNRLRMMVASFLVKDLRIHWLEGARWFWDTLVDADLASNTLGWQWSAGCGADAAPYFRVFNPILQGKKFDASGEYVRRWVPELKHVPLEHLHTPWTYGGVKGYPAPIVDHHEARQFALEAFETIKRKS
jgi:deoxyribodipyrimidine photo-lyase